MKYTVLQQLKECRDIIANSTNYVYICNTLSVINFELPANLRIATRFVLFFKPNENFLPQFLKNKYWVGYASWWSNNPILNKKEVKEINSQRVFFIDELIKDFDRLWEIFSNDLNNRG